MAKRCVRRAGLAATAYALWVWRSAGFGALEIEHIARISIPSGLAATLGIETILFSFFLSTMSINVRHHSTEIPAEYESAESV